MSNTSINYKLNLSPDEVVNGAKRIITRKGKRLEVTIPSGVKNDTIVKLNGALQITDGYYGDIFIQVKVKSRNFGILVIKAMAGLLILIICVVVIRFFITSSNSTTPITSTPETSSDFITVFNNKQPILNLGKQLNLVNNNESTNPTWQQLNDFLRSDKTDQNQYIFGSYMCADFAKEVHDNAEVAGIRAAFVGIFFKGDIEDHALNAFETTDRGLVYIDCGELDTIVYIEEDKEYQPISLYEPNNVTIEPMSIVEAVEIYWQ